MVNSCIENTTIQSSSSRSKNTIFVEAVPNPASDHVVLKSRNLNLKNSEILFTNLEGKRMDVSINSRSNHELKVNTSQLSNGIYFIKIIETDQTFSLKVKIQH